MLYKMPWMLYKMPWIDHMVIVDYGQRDPIFIYLNFQLWTLRLFQEPMYFNQMNTIKITAHHLL